VDAGKDAHFTHTSDMPLQISIFVTPIHPLNDVKKSDLVRLHYQQITHLICTNVMSLRYIENTICKSSIRNHNDNIDVGDSYCGRRI